VNIERTVNAFLDQRVLQRLRAEFLEMPDLKLRIDQVERLCGIEPKTCGVMLDALVGAGFLRLQTDGTYVRLTEGSEWRPRPAKTALKSTALVTVSRRAS